MSITIETLGPDWLEIVLALVGAFSTLFAFISVLAALLSAKAARDMMLSEFRPWLKIGYVTFPLGRLPNAAGDFAIEVDVANVGRLDTRILRSHGEVWMGKGLPMIRPYQDSDRNDFFEVDLKIQAGLARQRTFASSTVLSESDLAAIRSGHVSLFAMGFVRYLDQKTRRRTMFCWRYDPALERFIPSGDPLYEVQH